jgi:hypothetical protein
MSDAPEIRYELTENRLVIRHHDDPFNYKIFPTAKRNKNFIQYDVFNGVKFKKNVRNCVVCTNPPASRKKYRIQIRIDGNTNKGR